VQALRPDRGMDLLSTADQVAGRAAQAEHPERHFWHLASGCGVSGNDDLRFAG
jgi:hypothetical protein